MKREIKFRAWNNKFKDFKFMSLVKYLGGRGILDDWADSEHSVWEQYTGIKDNNGWEIYEGDIVQVTSEDGEFYVAAVKWFGDEGYPAFDLAGNPAAWCYESNALATIFEGSFETCEVIGNVHENPELLEVDNGD